MPNNLYCNIDGVLMPAEDAAIGSLDDAVRSRFGLFETILVHGGHILLAARHWRRLLTGLSTLGFKLPAHFHEAYLNQEAGRLLAVCAPQPWYRLRVQVFADGEDTDLYTPVFLMECFPVEQSIPFINSRGLEAGILEHYKKQVNKLSNLKCSHNDYAQPARLAAQQYQWEEVLLLNEYGHVAETAIANIFYVQQGNIYTPPLSEGCLNGIMRQWWLERLRILGIEVTELPLTLDRLQQADELFVTNSIRPLRWIERVGEQHYSHQLIDQIWSLGMDLYK